MTSSDIVERIDWPDVAVRLDVEGYAVLPSVLAEDDVHALAAQVKDMEASSRSTQASSASGDCDPFCFGDDLPPLLERWATELYRPLSAIANRWNEILG